jgi:hypothetical protein
MITWFDLSKLPVGAKLVLREDRLVNASGITRHIPAGTAVEITENGLNEIWSGIIVRMLDQHVAAGLRYFQSEFDGQLIIDGPDPHEEAAWQMPSPFDSPTFTEVEFMGEITAYPNEGDHG